MVSAKGIRTAGLPKKSRFTKMEVEMIYLLIEDGKDDDAIIQAFCSLGHDESAIYTQQLRYYRQKLKNGTAERLDALQRKRLANRLALSQNDLFLAKDEMERPDEDITTDNAKQKRDYYAALSEKMKYEKLVGKLIEVDVVLDILLSIKTEISLFMETLGHQILNEVYPIIQNYGLLAAQQAVEERFDRAKDDLTNTVIISIQNFKKKAGG